MTSHHIPPQVAFYYKELSVCVAADSLSPSGKVLKIDCAYVMGLMYVVGVCVFV